MKSSVQHVTSAVLRSKEITKVLQKYDTIINKSFRILRPRKSKMRWKRHLPSPLDCSPPNRTYLNSFVSKSTVRFSYTKFVYNLLNIGGLDLCVQIPVYRRSASRKTLVQEQYTSRFIPIFSLAIHTTIQIELIMTTYLVQTQLKRRVRGFTVTFKV